MQPQLAELAGCSKIGKAMFALAIQMVNGDQFEKDMADMVKALENYCFFFGGKGFVGR